MRTFGTLGHVDHGKSTLVRVLTGIDPDRLVEEKAREMTIDLGFAWLTLPSGDKIGIVDVPGHRDFIENMIAGVTGVEAVILIVAADEGIMPQTREHIAILKLLGIQHGVIVMTKTDLVEDEGWLVLVEEDIRSVLAGTPLKAAPIVRASARTDSNLGTLFNALETCTASMPPHKDTGAPHLAIDRVFTMHGFGTVVTGTLRNGTLYKGDEVEIQPGAHHSRVRTLQIHGTEVSSAHPGNRVAVNLAGIDRESLKRGDVLSRPGRLHTTQRLDAFVTVSLDAPAPLRHNTHLKLFIHTADDEVRIRVLGEDDIAPGSSGWMQIETRQPIVATKGDRFLLRQLSPSATIAGGIVIDPHPERRHRRFDRDILAALEKRLDSSPAMQLAQAADGLQPVSLDILRTKSGLDTLTFSSAFATSVEQGLLVEILDGLYMSGQRVSSLLAQVRGELYDYHDNNPLHRGMSQEVLRRRLGVKPPVFQTLARLAQDILLDSGIAAFSSHRITFSTQQELAIARLERELASRPYTPPSYSEASALVEEEVLEALISLGSVIRLSSDVIFDTKIYHELVSEVLAIIDQDGSITVATVRDRYETSRKYALAILEYLDSQGITKRVGDARVRGHRS